MYHHVTQLHSRFSQALICPSTTLQVVELLKSKSPKPSPRPPTPPCTLYDKHKGLSVGCVIPPPCLLGNHASSRKLFSSTPGPLRLPCPSPPSTASTRWSTTSWTSRTAAAGSHCPRRQGHQIHQGCQNVIWICLQNVVFTHYDKEQNITDVSKSMNGGLVDELIGSLYTKRF